MTHVREIVHVQNTPSKLSIVVLKLIGLQSQEGAFAIVPSQLWCTVIPCAQKAPKWISMLIVESEQSKANIVW